MAGLTRTAKFADLRDQLANDKEPDVNSRDLSSYQDRFNNVQETLEPNTMKQQASFEKPAYNEPLYQAPVYQAPAYNQAQAPVNNAQTVSKQQTNDYFNFFNSVDNNQNNSNNNSNDFNSFFDNSLNELNMSFSTNNNQNVFNNVNDVEANRLQQQERDSYLDQTFDDVARWNANNGQQTIENIVENSINEVRHNQPQLDADQFNFNAPIQDDEFSDQVTTEINKIMADFNTSSFNGPLTNDGSQNTAPIYTAPINQTYGQPNVEPTPVNTAPIYTAPINQTYSQPSIEPKPVNVAPVMPKTVNVAPVSETVNVAPQSVYSAPKEDTIKQAVDIKPYNEVQQEIARDTMSQTIQYVVSDKEELIEDEYDDEGSNTVLNVILIILIVILIAVLGLIVFYILKTQGIL